MCKFVNLCRQKKKHNEMPVKPGHDLSSQSFTVMTMIIKKFFEINAISRLHKNPTKFLVRITTRWKARGHLLVSSH
jgi:hypothetical protein